MKNRFLTLLVALLMLAAGVQLAQAQASTDQNRGRNRPIIEGGVESVGGRLQISLSNTDDIRSVSGSARISLGASGQQSEKVEFTLAPQESRLFPLGSRGEPGDNYTLTVIEQAGAVIFIKNAPVKRGAVAAPIVTAPSNYSSSCPGRHNRHNRRERIDGESETDCLEFQPDTGRSHHFPGGPTAEPNSGYRGSDDRAAQRAGGRSNQEAVSQAGAPGKERRGQVPGGRACETVAGRQILCAH